MKTSARRHPIDSTADAPLTARERAFVGQYLLTANGAKAAKAAGYSAKSAKVTASRLFAKANVAGAIGRAQASRAEHLSITQDHVLQELEELAFSDISHYRIDPVAGTVELMEGAPRRAMRAIASIKHRVIRVGKNGVIHEIEFRLWDKPSMLRLAGRHIGVAGFTNRLEITGKNGQSIEFEQRVNEMSDEALKARVTELMAKL
jgi:phage terminase small subunit